MAAPDRANVLVVDDEPQIVAVASIVLSRAGYDVLTACDAEEALAVFSDSLKPVDLVLADIKLPGIDGYELISRIRQISPATKLMLTSGFNDEQPLAGIPFLAKPFTMMQLLASVEAALGTTTHERAQRVGASADH